MKKKRTFFVEKVITKIGDKNQIISAFANVRLYSIVPYL